MIKFVGSFEELSSLPNTQFKEFAFVGRSNVGKSSLINSIFGMPVARVSSLPGKTRTFNLFNFGNKLIIVDLPGYGYAKISKTESSHWLERLEKYLIERRQLKRLFILIDSRIGTKDMDIELMDFCDKNGISYQIVYTKKDKKVRETKQKNLSHLKHGAMIDEVLETSAKNKIGIEKLRKIIGIK